LMRWLVGHSCIAQPKCRFAAFGEGNEVHELNGYQKVGLEIAEGSNVRGYSQWVVEHEKY
jgi:hypothetical protein